MLIHNGYYQNKTFFCFEYGYNAELIKVFDRLFLKSRFDFKGGIYGQKWYRDYFTW